MIHVDPDFQSLSINQRQTALKCLYAISEHGNVNRASGVAQIHLIHAIGTTLLGVESSMDAAYISDIEIANLKHLMSEVEEPIRHRLFQLFDQMSTLKRK